MYVWAVKACTAVQQHPYMHFSPAQHAAAAAAAMSASFGQLGISGVPPRGSQPLGGGSAGMYMPQLAPLAPLAPNPAVMPPPPPTASASTLTASTSPPLPPASPTKPIRDKQPNYEKDWLLPACQTELRRRAELAGEKGVLRYGDGEDDVKRSMSNVKKKEAADILVAHDAWKVSKGLDPDWKQAPQGTPEAKRLAYAAKAAIEKEQDGDKRRTRSSADAARLAFILFSDEVYTHVLQSEQAPTDRNKRDLHALGAKDPEGIWDKVVDYFLDEDLKLGGISPGNPKSHAGCTAPGVEKMWETLQALDHNEPCSKWRDEWTIKDGPKKGQLDKARARLKIHGWWKDMRAEYRIARKKVEQSGEHAEHHWSFCNQKFYVMLMMDWYALRGGDGANDFCKQYFDVQLDEESGGAFNSISTEQESSDSNDELSLVKKRKRGRRRTASTKPEKAFAGLASAFKETGNSIARAMSALADNESPDLVDTLITASDRVEELEEKLEGLKQRGAGQGKINRVAVNLKVAEAAYKKAKLAVDEANGVRTTASGEGGAAGRGGEGSDSDEPLGEEDSDGGVSDGLSFAGSVG